MTRELAMTHFGKRAFMISHQLGEEDHELACYVAPGRAA